MRFALIFLVSSLFASFPSDVSGRVLYLMYRGECEQAMEIYSQQAKQEGHDFALLQEAGMRLLEQGSKNEDPEIRLMCMFGAGVSLAPDLLPILERGLECEEMGIVLAALSFLSKMRDDDADRVMMSALASPSLLVRLETCFQLALKNHTSVLQQLQSLYVKVPRPARVLFPQIAVHIDTPRGTAFLRRMFSEGDLNVRLAAVLEAAKLGRDDLLVPIRTMAKQAQHAEQEAALFALGILKDRSYERVLAKHLESHRPTVAMAAAFGLDALGDEQGLPLVYELAKSGDLFAVRALAKLKTEKAQEVLQKMISHRDRDVRLNASIALLEHKDPRAVKPLLDFLLRDSTDLGFLQIASAGQVFKAWRCVPSAQQQKLFPTLVGDTLAYRSEALLLSLELQEEYFLNVARQVLLGSDMDLVPLLVELLRNHESEATRRLLKEMLDRAGAPMVRGYCNLALFRMKEKGPYEENLITWARKWGHKGLIQFKDTGEPTVGSPFNLTPQENSRLLIETFEALAASQNEAGIGALVHAIAHGNPKNRYALAGLLIRTTE